MDWRWSLDHLEASMKDLSDAMAELQDQARLMAHETHSTQTPQPFYPESSPPPLSMAALPTVPRHQLHAQSQRESQRNLNNFADQFSIDDLEEAAAEVHAILDSNSAEVNKWESKRTTKSKVSEATPSSQFHAYSASATIADKVKKLLKPSNLKAEPSHNSTSGAHHVDASSAAVAGHQNLSHNTLSEQPAAQEATIEHPSSNIEMNETENLKALEEASSMAARGKHLMFADRSGAGKHHIGSVASLDELGYSQVALLQDSLEMAIFANRVMESEHLELAKPQPFDYMIRYHSGECAVQNFQALLAELHRGVHRPAGCGGPWVQAA
jgi:hypothetical protein